MLSLLVLLLLAHILGDFVLQPQAWVKHKTTYKHTSKYLYIHVLVHAILGFILLYLSGNEYLWVVLPISVSHYLIDLAKLSLENIKNSKLLFFVDQSLHLLVLAIVSILATNTTIDLSQLLQPKIILLLTTLLCATAVSAIVMRILLQNWTLEVTKKKNRKSLKSAGKYIGLLERSLVFTFVVLNQWPAIGFLIAAKSAFRFGDLSQAKNRKLTEYVLIGTLLSFGLAILFGIFYLQLLKHY